VSEFNKIPSYLRLQQPLRV